jgi:hypothetical protein
MNPRRALRWILLASAGAAIFGVCDLAFSWNPLARLAYLAHAHEPVFRAAPLLSLGFLAECANGWIAALAYGAVAPALAGPSWRRGLIFGVGMWGFWVVSGTFTAAVWLAVPWSVAASNVAFGLPKCLAIGALIALCARRLELA